MKIITGFLWALPLALLSSLGADALARRADLTVLPIRDVTANCPQSLTAYETPRPYTQGGFATDGMIHLNAIATDISITQANDFNVVWTGTLKPEYRNCKASAGINRVDGEGYPGHSYIRVQLEDGQARAILDMTGVGDPNGSTLTILYQGMRDGNPRWAWGGTD